MPQHPDFVKILKQFKLRYGDKEGTQKFYMWLNKRKLDDTKPYSTAQIQKKESFTWAKPLMQLLKQDKTGKTWKVEAHFVTTSMNDNVYTKKEIAQAISTLPGKHVDLNHNLDWKIDGANMLAAALENDCAEVLLHVKHGTKDAKNRDVNQTIETGDIDCVSIEADADYVIQSEEGNELVGLQYTGLALLDQEALPGIPLTRLLPMENLVESIFESIDEQGQDKTDSQRAQDHFGLTINYWNSLSDDEKQDYIRKLPKRLRDKDREIKENPTSKPTENVTSEEKEGEVKKLDEKTQTVEELQKEIEDLKAEAKLAEAKLLDNKNEFDTLTKKLVETRTDLETTTRDLAKKDKEISTATKKLQSTNERIDTLETKLAETDTKLKETEGKLREQEERVIDKNRTIKRQEDDISQLREDVGKLTQARETAVSEMNEAKEKMGAARQRANDEIEARSKLQEELAEVRKRLANAIRSEASTAEKSANEAEHIVSMELELKQLKEDKKKLNDLIVEWQQKHESAIKQNKRLKKIQRSYGIAEVDENGNVII